MFRAKHTCRGLCLAAIVACLLGCQPAGPVLGDAAADLNDTGNPSGSTPDTANQTDPGDNGGNTDTPPTDPGNNPDGGSITDPNDGWTGSDTSNGDQGDDSNGGGGGGDQQQPANIAPVAQDQSVTATAGQPLEITLLGTDQDDGPQPLSFRIIANPAHGTLAGTPPTVIYTAPVTYTGPDEFTFQVGDGAEASEVATVSIDVRPDFAHLYGVYRIAEIIDASGETDYPQPGVDEFGRWEIRDSKLYGWWSIGEVEPGNEPFFVRLDTNEPQEIVSGGVTYTITVTSITQSINPETRVFSATYEELVTDPRSSHTEKFVLTGTISEDAQTIVGTATFAYAGKTALNRRPVVFERMSDADAAVPPLPNTTRNMSIFCGQGVATAAPMILLLMLPFSSVGRRWRGKLFSR